jgi:hypothetical protein
MRCVSNELHSKGGHSNTGFRMKARTRQRRGPVSDNPINQKTRPLKRTFNLEGVLQRPVEPAPFLRTWAVGDVEDSGDKQFDVGCDLNEAERFQTRSDAAHTPIWILCHRAHGHRAWESNPALRTPILLDLVECSRIRPVHRFGWCDRDPRGLQSAKH